MRSGLYTVQQALAPEAAAVVKQAVALARRRGHAQVTPLHVASAMLSSPAGILRTACLRSAAEQQQSQNPFPVQYPFQCKALDLCFNVALNRLPAASPAAGSPFLGNAAFHPHQYSPPPLLSNALVAAFKRAQANQRRGTSEQQQQQQQQHQQQQQAVVAARIEVEQLVVSILDDPSVSRVMREAGFRSTQVKADVEKSFLNSSSRHSSPISAERKRQSPSSSPPHASYPSNDHIPRQRFNRNAEDEEDEVVVIDAVPESVPCKRFRNRGVFGSPLLDFHPDLTVEPAAAAPTTGSLDLRLGTDSDLQTVLGRRNVLYSGCWTPVVQLGDQEISQLNCCPECTHKYYKEAAALGRAASCYQIPITSGLPSWLQQHKEERRDVTAHDQEKLRLIQELRQKWNSICQATHNSSAESSAIKVASSRPGIIASTCHEQIYNLLNNGQTPWLSELNPNPSVGVFASIDLATPVSSASSSSSEAAPWDLRYRSHFSGLSSENLNRLCDAMEKAAPQQNRLIPEIASTILQCRSGMRRRRWSTSLTSNDHRPKRETLLLFRGTDVESKERVGQALAEVVFGERPVVVRPGKEFNAAVTENPHRMFWVDVVEHVKLESMIETLTMGRLYREGGRVELEDAIIILCLRDTGEEGSITESRGCFGIFVREAERMDCEINDGEGRPLEIGLELNLSTVNEGDDNFGSAKTTVNGLGVDELLHLVDGSYLFDL